MTECSKHALVFFCNLQTCEQAVKGSRTRKRELNACLTTCSPLQPAALLFAQLTNALRESTAERLHVIGIVDFLTLAFQTIAILCPGLQPRLHRSCLGQVHPHPRDCGLMQKHFLKVTWLCACVFTYYAGRPVVLQSFMKSRSNLSIACVEEARSSVNKEDIRLA